MRRDSQHNVLLLLGAMLLQTGLSDLHLRYVKAAMQPLLIASGVVLLLLGGIGVLTSLRTAAGRRTGAAADGHQHSPPGVAWLVVLPLLVLVVAVPPSLGAYAAAREPASVTQPAGDVPPLEPPRDGAVDLSVSEYAGRAVFVPDTVAGRPVRLVGFVTVADGEWYVTRMRLSCCAADGRPVKVLARGAEAPPPDSWVQVVGTLPAGQDAAGQDAAGQDAAGQDAAGQDEQVPVLELNDVRAVAQPQQTYE